MPRVSSDNKDFIIPVVFDVSKVLYGTGIIRDPGITFGGKREMTGVIPEVSLQVNATENNCPTTLLKFKGFCNIEAGNRIRAYIEKYTEKEIGGYAERDFFKGERVSKIEKLADDTRVLAVFEGLSKEECY